MNKLTAVLVLALLALGGWMVKSYGDGRAKTALMLRARDSLATVQSQFLISEESRQRQRATDSLKIGGLTTELGEARLDMSRQNERHRAAVGTLEARLANDTTISDTVRVLVFEAIEAAEAEVMACKGALTKCDSIGAAQERVILSLKETAVNQDSLLHAYQVQLDAAVKAANPGFFTRAKRSTPLVLGSIAAGFLLAQILGG